jgi:hypothetical protein
MYVYENVMMKSIKNTLKCCWFIWKSKNLIVNKYSLGDF